MSKFAIVGCEASGKTVFMSALCDCFRESIVPENLAANRFARFAARQLRALRQWPPATPPGKAVEMDFTLRENGRVLAELGLLEFGGETFRAAFREDESEPTHKRAVNDLLAFLGDADFVLVLVSLQELFRDPGETPIDEFERDTESIWVTRGLLEFIQDHAPTANIVLGLTQADRYARELSEGGGAARVLARRWPSIHAVAPDLTVIPVASVSATDAQGRPAEDFSTDGILPVLKEFARLEFGAPADLLLTLSTTGTSLASAYADSKLAPTRLSEITRLTKRFNATLNALRAVRTLTHDSISEELARAEEKRADFERKLKDLRTQLPKRKASRKSKRGRPIVRRAFLYALLLASTILFANAYWPRIRSEETVPKPPEMTVPKPPRPVDAFVSNASNKEGNPLSDAIETIASTGFATASPNKDKHPSSDAIETIASTNLAPAPKEINPPTNAAPTRLTEEPPYRIWHDHNGKAIEARWIDTAKDKKSITIETRSGRRLRAVLYKFSEADRAFVREKMNE